MWYLTRGSGVVATLLMLAAIANGVLFSARETGRRLKPNWWLDLHNGIGGYALIFTGIHVATALAARDLGLSVAGAFVPGASSFERTAMTWGVLAFYGCAVTVLSSWPRKRGSRRVWHLVHLISVPATVLACVHALQIGSDQGTPVFRGLLILGVAVAVYCAGLRLTGLVRRRPLPAS